LGVGDDDLIFDPDTAYSSTIEPRLHCHHFIDTKNRRASRRKNWKFVNIEPNPVTHTMNKFMFYTCSSKY
jgi:hypothetical protein